MGDVKHFPNKDLDARAMLKKIFDERADIKKVVVVGFFEDGENIWISHFDKATLSVAAMVMQQTAMEAIQDAIEDD